MVGSGGWRPAPVGYQDPCHQQPSVERSAPPPHHVPHPQPVPRPPVPLSSQELFGEMSSLLCPWPAPSSGPGNPAATAASSRRKLQFWCAGCASLQTTRAKNIAKSGSQTSASRGAGDRHWEGSSILTSIHLHNKYSEWVNSSSSIVDYSSQCLTN